MPRIFTPDILRLYLVLDPNLCGGAQGMVDTARAAAANGATLVQLRAPQWKKRALVECARALKKVLAPFGVPLIVNDHADVCLAANAEGLHVGQKDLSPVDARALIGPDRILGLSANTAEHFSVVDRNLVDYLGVGPIALTRTKTDTGAALGITGFAALASCKPCPIVAIGSVSALNARDLMRAGADGIAVVSAICGKPDAARATRELADIVNFRDRPQALS